MLALHITDKPLAMHGACRVAETALLLLNTSPALDELLRLYRRRHVVNRCARFRHDHRWLRVRSYSHSFTSCEAQGLARCSLAGLPGRAPPLSEVGDTA